VIARLATGHLANSVVPVVAVRRAVKAAVVKAKAADAALVAIGPAATVVNETVLVADVDPVETAGVMVRPKSTSTS
jgi:hypothetical protein